MGQPVTGPAGASRLRADYTILVTDANLTVLGDPLHEWPYLQATLRWKEPGSGQVVLPAHRYIRDQLVPGCRIVVLRRVLGQTTVLLTGPMEQRLRERSDDGENGGVGRLTISFADDLAWLAARVAYPDPNRLPQNQAHDYWQYTGNPEQGMLTLVDTQADPNALAARRVPKLQVAPFSGMQGTGTDVAPRERLERLTDVLRSICTLGVGTGHPDSLGFRICATQNAAGADLLLFEPVRSRDLAGDVHFSFAMGNLKYYSWQENAPTLTHPIVGGQGTGADRFVNEFPTTDLDQIAWGHFEGYVPMPGTSTLAGMQAAATQALQEAGQSGRLASRAADTVDQRFGMHDNVGDLVSVELDIAETVTAPVQTVSLQAWPTAGEVVGCTIGDQGARYDSAWIRQMRLMDTRIGKLERRALVA